MVEIPNCKKTKTSDETSKCCEALETEWFSGQRYRAPYKAERASQGAKLSANCEDSCGDEP